MTRSSLSLLAALFGFAPLATAQLDAPALLPESTLAWAGVDDAGTFFDAWSETANGRLWTDESFEDFWAEIENGLSYGRDNATDTLGIDPMELIELFEGGVALALVELGPPETPDGDPAVGLALLAEVAEGAEEELLDELDRLAERLTDARPEDFVLKFEERGGVEASVLSDPAGDGEIAFAIAGGTAVGVLAVGSALDSALLDGMVAALEGESEARLADAPAFAGSLLAAERPAGQVGAWLDTRRFADTLFEVRAAGGLDADAGEDWDRAMLEAMGFLDVGPFSMVRYFDGGRGRGEITLSWGPDFPLGKLLSAGLSGQRPRAFAWMADDVNSAMAMELDVGGIFDAIVEFLGDVEPEAMKELVLGMAAAEADLGFHPRDDVIAALDGQVGFFVKEPAGGVDPFDPFAGVSVFALTLGLADAELMREFLDATVRAQGLHVAREREVFEGFEVYKVPVLPGISLHYSISADVLVLSLDGGLIRDVLRRLGDSELTSLASDADFDASRQLLPADATALMAVDSAAAARSILDAPQTMLMLMEANGAGELPMVPWGDELLRLDQVVGRLQATIPTSDVVGRFLDGYEITNYALSERGLSITSVTP